MKYLYRNKSPEWNFILFISIILIPFIIRVIYTLHIHATEFDNEGWNALNTQSLMGGGTLYPPIDTYQSNNYTPLFYLLCYPFVLITNEAMITGRIVSLVSFAILCWATYRTSLALGCRHAYAAIGCVFLLAMFLTDSKYVGSNEPQVTGHALGAIGLLILVLNPASAKRAAWSSVLLALAIFTKPNLISLPIACFLWLLRYHKNSALTFAIAGATFLIGEFFASYLIWGRDIFDQLLQPRHYDWHRSYHYWMRTLGNYSPFFIACLITLVPGKHQTPSKSRIVWFYLLIGFVICQLMFPGDGVKENIFFDVNIGLALCLASGLQNFDVQGYSFKALPWIKALILGLWFIPIAVSFVLRQQDRLNWDYWTHPLHYELDKAIIATTYLKYLPDPVLMSNLAWTYWSGHQRGFDPFMYSQRRALGIDGDKVETAIKERLFSAIEDDELGPRAWGTRFREVALASGYHTIVLADGVQFLIRDNE